MVPQDLVEKLDARYARVIHAHYQGMVDAEGDFGHVRVTVEGASVDANGRTALLTTFIDTRSGNYLLPQRRLHVDEEGKPHAECRFEGGSPYFQAMLFTFLGGHVEGADLAKLRFRADYFIPEVTLIPELARLAHADWRSPLAGELEDFLWKYRENLERIGMVRVAADPDQFLVKLLLHSERHIYFTGVGDWDGNTLVCADFGAQFPDPLQHPAGSQELTGAGGGRPTVAVRPSERMLSAIRQRAQEDGDILLEEGQVDARFGVPKIAEALTQMLKTRVPEGTWESDWKVRIQVPSLSPEGTLNAVVVIEDGDGNFILPWLSDVLAPRVLRSDRFMGYSVSVVVPPKVQELLQAVGSALSPVESEPVRVDIVSAHIPSDYMESEVRVLSGRSSPGREPDAAEARGPSFSAKESIFFGPLKGLVADDLITRGQLTAAQAVGLSLSDIRVVRHGQDPLERLHDAEIYLVHVAHQLGAHVVRFARRKETGAVTFFGFGEVVGFFPEVLTTRRELPSGGFDLL